MPHAHPPRTTIGLAVPESFGTGRLSMDELVARCATLGASVLEVAAPLIETFLGAPPEPALLHPPEDDFETGLLPIEEEVFRDELELARTTFAGYVRQWRTSVSLAPLAHLRRQCEEADLRIALVRWDDLGTLADDEVDYAFRVTAELGARALVTDFSDRGARRLGPFASKHQRWLGFRGDEGTSAEALTAVLDHGPFNCVSVDVANWVPGSETSALAFLDRHAARVSHVRLTDRTTGDDPHLPFGQGAARISEALETQRDHQWPFPAIVELESDLPDGPARMAHIARDLEFCRARV